MSTKTHEKPANLLPEHLEFLDDLRESGEINMMGAAEPLRNAYPSLSQRESRDILFYWMDNFAYA